MFLLLTAVALCISTAVSNYAVTEHIENENNINVVLTIK